MSKSYADLATLKSPAVLNVPDNVHDARLLGMLETASRWIDGYCGRNFSALHDERRFDGTGKSSITVPDVVSVNGVRVRKTRGRWEGWSSSDWLLYPLNAAPTVPGGRPYTRILLASGTHRRFPLSRAGVIVDGVWGYGDVREDTGLQIDTADPVAADAGTFKVAGAPATDLSAGHTIRIDDEQMYVVGAVDDGQAALTLTVRRGVNGTNAASHAAGADVSVYRYPGSVGEACLLQAAVWWRERLSAPFRPPEGEGAQDAEGVIPTVRTLLAPYRRRHAVLGV